MRVGITKQDISNGIRNSITRCPIARRLKLMGFSIVYVGSDRVKITDVGWGGVFTTSARLSRKAEKFVEDFDSKKPVKPFTTNLKFS